MVVLLKVECKDVGVHECPSALAKDIHSLRQELNLDPGGFHGVHLLLKGLKHNNINVMYISTTRVGFHPSFYAKADPIKLNQHLPS